jgi:hypothetical protein
MRRKETFSINTREIVSIPNMETNMDTFRPQMMISLLRHVNYDDPILEFVSDELCLAIANKMPIFCAETSSWKIVELLRAIGAKVKEESRAYAEKKADYFRKRKNWKEMAAEALGVAFGCVVAGPIGLLPALGPPVIKVLVKDP